MPRKPGSHGTFGTLSALILLGIAMSPAQGATTTSVSYINDDPSTTYWTLESVGTGVMTSYAQYGDLEGIRIDDNNAGGDGSGFHWAPPQGTNAAADAALTQFGKVHLLCNNAGVSTGGLVEDCDAGDWDWTIGVNYLGVLHGCQAFVPHIKRQGEGGHIVNTSSMAGLLGGMAGWGPYNSTKFAVVGLTEVLRQEGRIGGFGASVLCPGGVATNIFDAPRNRPDRFGPQVSNVAYDNTGEGIEEALNPDVVGRLVLEAVRNNRLYIFTDPRFQKLMVKKHERMLDDLKWAAGTQALVEAGAPGAFEETA